MAVFVCIEANSFTDASLRQLRSKPPSKYAPTAEECRLPLETRLWKRSFWCVQGTLGFEHLFASVEDLDSITRAMTHRHSRLKRGRRAGLQHFSCAVRGLELQHAALLGWPLPAGRIESYPLGYQFRKLRTTASMRCSNAPVPRCNDTSLTLLPYTENFPAPRSERGGEQGMHRLY